jgi:FG-GAP-like repeat
MIPHHPRWLFVTAILVAIAPAQSPNLLFDVPIVVGDAQTRLRATLDYDADGFVDFVSVWFTSPTTVVVKGFRGDGAGNLIPDWSITLPGIVPVVANNLPAAPIATGDFDGDGRTDFVLAIDRFVGYWLSNGAGVVPTIGWVWEEPAVIAQVLAADFNGDGRPDIALQQNLEVRIYLTQASGTPVLASSATFPSGTWGSWIFITEANGDATPDVGVLTTTGGPGSLVELHPVSAGVMQAPLTFAITTGTTAFPVSGDIDGDSDEDVVVFTTTSSGWWQSVVLRRNGGAFTVEAPVPGGPATHLVDFDQDGDIDGVGAGIVYPSSSLSISLNDGSGGFAPAGGFPIVGMPAAIDGHLTMLAGMSDVNQDGAPDLVAGRSLYFGRGPGTNPPVPSGAWIRSRRDLADFDGDGDPDIHPGDPATVGFGVTKANQGDGTFLPGTITVPPPGFDYWAGAGFPGDFDGDQDVDLLVDAYPSTFLGTTHLLKNLGCGVFVDAGPAAAGTMRAIPLSPYGLMPQEPASCVVRDLDNDGDLDFIGVYVETVSQAYGHSKVWWNQGGGFFIPGPDLPWTIVVGAEEMTSDGIVDLIACYQLGTAAIGQLVVLPGLGGGAYAPIGSAILLDPDTHRRNGPGIGDLDGDGDPDVFSVGNHSATVILNAGNGSFGPSTAYPALAPPPLVLAPGVFPVARHGFVVDVDLDGRLDVVAYPLAATPNTTGIMLRDGPNGAFGTTAAELFVTHAFADVDGDGDFDALGENRVARNLRHVPPAGGSRRQYGTGIAGSGGIIPILGEVGPFRPLETVEIRLTGGLGGTSGLLAVGTSPASSPLLGGTLLVTPDFFLPIQLTGSAGVPGTGSLSLSVVIPASLAGVSIWHQAGLVDPGASFGVSATNGLRIALGY